MKYIKKVWKIICWPYAKWKEHREIKKRMKELRKQDPFIYK